MQGSGGNYLEVEFAVTNAVRPFPSPDAPFANIAVQVSSTQRQLACSRTGSPAGGLYCAVTVDKITCKTAVWGRTEAKPGCFPLCPVVIGSLCVCTCANLNVIPPLLVY